MLDYYSAIFRTKLLFCLFQVIHGQTECRNRVRGESYQCDRGCCGSKPDQYCCTPSSYIAYLIVVAVLVSVLLVVLIAVCYKKKTESRRRTRPGVVVVRMGDRRSDLPRPCIDGSDRTNFNYYHFQWVYGQPVAPPPYCSESTSVHGTHAPNNTSGNCQQYRNTSNRENIPTTPPPPYSYHDNTESDV